MPSVRLLRRLSVLTSLLLATTCAESATAPAPRVAALAIVSGNSQSGIVGTPLSSVLTVRAVTSTGAPVGGATILWSTASGSVSPASSVTAADGLASATWTLGSAAGSVAASASAGTSIVAAYSATALPASASVLERVSVETQATTAGSTLSLTVRVRDAFGNAVAGATPTWTPTSGSGTTVSVSPTDALGLSTASIRVDTLVGTQPWLAAIAGGTSVGFTATISAGPVARVKLVGDSLVLGTWGDTLRGQAVVSDRFGNVRVGIPVTWSSSDTSIARVNGAGLVTSERFGIATITLRADTATGIGRAVVRRQLNPACVVPGAVVARGAASGAVTFVDEGSARFPGRNLPASGNDLIIIDRNGDGRVDILQFNSTYAGATDTPGATYFWHNTGTGFEDSTSSAFNGGVPLASFPHNPLVGDFNGDGRPDVYVGQSGFDSSPYPGARNLLLLSNGTRYDERGNTSLAPNDAGHTHAADAADVDCDGDLDIVDVDINTPSVSKDVRYLRNNGAGVFTDIASSRFGPELLSTFNAPFLALALCDLDRDGDADLIGGGWSSGGVRYPDRLYANDGFGRFRERAASLPPAIYGNNTRTVDIQCLDYDGDGYNDLVLSTNPDYATGRIALWRNNGQMGFTDVTASATGSFEWPTNTYPGRSWVADFNNDGWPDVLSQGYGDPWNGFWSPSVQGGNAIYFNRGDGTFNRVAMANQFGALWPMDVNADGRMDLVWGGYAQTTGLATQRTYVQP